MIQNPKQNQPVLYGGKRAVIVALPRPTAKAKGMPRRVCIMTTETGLLSVVNPHALQPDPVGETFADEQPGANTTTGANAA